MVNINGLGKVGKVYVRATFVARRHTLQTTTLLFSNKTAQSKANKQTHQKRTCAEDRESIAASGDGLTGVHVNAGYLHFLSRSGHIDQITQQNHLRCAFEEK